MAAGTGEEKVEDKDSDGRADDKAMMVVLLFGSQDLVMPASAQ